MQVALIFRLPYSLFFSSSSLFWHFQAKAFYHQGDSCLRCVCMLSVCVCVCVCVCVVVWWIFCADLKRKKWCQGKLFFKAISNADSLVWPKCQRTTRPPKSGSSENISRSPCEALGFTAFQPPLHSVSSSVIFLFSNTFLFNAKDRTMYWGKMRNKKQCLPSLSSHSSTKSKWNNCHLFIFWVFLCA